MLYTYLLFDSHLNVAYKIAKFNLIEMLDMVAEVTIMNAVIFTFTY